MNAVTSCANDLIQDNNGGGSDSESNPDEAPEYYQPISAEADDGESDFDDGENSNSDDDADNHQFNLQSRPNGCASFMENGVLSLDLSEEDDIEEDEEDERMREESDMAIQRAFREDESRRNTPLTPENSMRVMEAMRGISFGGLAPDWAGHIPEDQWIDQFRRMRRPTPASSSVQD